MVKNAAKLWRIADEVEQQRLQTAIFPEGLTYDFISGFGTAKTSDLYQLIEQFETNLHKSNDLVGLVGFEPTTNRL